MFIADHNLPMRTSQQSHVYNSEIFNLMLLMIYFL